MDFKGGAMIKTFRNDLKVKKRLQELIVDFSQKAKDWGCQREYGIGSAVGEAEADYEQAQDKLVRYLNRVLRK
jgi:hypothetical protein